MTAEQLRRISRLGREAAESGDLRQYALGVLAIGGRGALEGAEPGTEQHTLLAEGMTQEEAIAECLRVLQ